MSFIWPQLLWCLVAVPALVWLYVWMLRRRKRGAVRLASLGAVKEAMGPSQRIRRHVPPALLLLALGCVLLGMARPTATITLPSHHQTIVLAMDVSLSMRATDVQPNRITAAQEAAREFVKQIPSNVKVGIVAFGGTAAVVQNPTHDREALVEAIDRFQLQRGTATGSALLLSLATLFPDHGIDLEQHIFGRNFGSRDANANRNVPIDRPKAVEKKEWTPVPPGSYSNGAIILLSDGRRTTGPDPLMAAQMAADRGVRVFTVGFGTLEGGSIGFEGWSFYVRLDEETLKAIAGTTRAEYFHASSGAELARVYKDLNDRFVMERKETEVTALFAGAAALLAAAAGLLSMLWFNRFG
jgi:Ca-activated chloride channel family protein